MKYSIRDLVFVLTIIALLLGWWVDSATRVHELNEDRKLQRWKADTFEKIMTKDGYEISIGRETISAIGPKRRHYYDRPSSIRRTITGKVVQEWQ